MAEICMIVVAVSAAIAAIALAVIASKLHWVVVYLTRLTKALDQLRTNPNHTKSASPADEDGI
jgi:hypothetical protein